MVLIVCTKCDTSKPSSEFHRDKQKPDGFRHECKDCRTASCRLARVASDPDRARAYLADWRRRNRDKSRAYTAKWKLANPEKFSQGMLKWRRENPERVLAIAAARRSRRSLPKADREISVAYRIAIRDSACAYCGTRGSEMHYDHVVPLSRGGTDHWWNLVRACADCNLHKSARTPEEWAAAIERETRNALDS